MKLIEKFKKKNKLFLYIILNMMSIVNIGEGRLIYDIFIIILLIIIIIILFIMIIIIIVNKKTLYYHICYLNIFLDIQQYIFFN